MTPAAQSNFNWIQMKYGQMSLHAESLLEQVNALKVENAQLKEQLEEKKNSFLCAVIP